MSALQPYPAISQSQFIHSTALYKLYVKPQMRPDVEFDPVMAWANIKPKIVDCLMTDRDRAEQDKKPNR